VAPPRTALDFSTLEGLRGRVAALASGADWVVNLVAHTKVDAAETERVAAFHLNRDAPREVALGAADAGARLLHLSTDYVFSGRAGARGRRPWRELDPKGPLSAYGQSKSEGEDAVLSVAGARPLVVRTSWLYGGGGRNFVDTVRTRLLAGEVLKVVEDQWGRPTWTASLAHALARVLETPPDPAGLRILHLANDGITTWHGVAREVARVIGVPDGRVVAVRSDDFPTPAPRPRWSPLDLSQARALLGDAPGALPHWRDALRQYLAPGLATQTEPRPA
jgi:dTDP-4-dehydrorhamnose reductase